MEYDYEWFKKGVYDLTKIDLNAYKEKQMKRRIDTLIGKYEVKGYDGFLGLIKKDREALDSFVTYLTINVSEFFRNMDQWNLMDKEMVPELMGKFGKNLKIWSAACSTGDEPYTIVMLLSKHIPLNQINVYATDLDAVVLAKAKAAIYDKKEISNVPDEFKKKYFTETEDGRMKVSSEITSRVTFKQADLLRDPYPKDCHLIVCRNVLIYFTEEAKDEVFRKYYEHLAPGGILFIGSTEQIVNYKDIGFIRKNSFYYEKPKA
ncbi:chemotaxis protein methyltransferase CheR [Butyrivibrio hungatei DSM 14810]|uniref:Chemotaxis protein methyltransferase CheR n=1 Tax=Butyrivibrio hungatei DSM 14810 TaxID=1121132 RepID=A0A1M7RRB3_9FIRM|nr:protein-glutamate O-methyltransferase CheR [Butyrivibrio hungatei]SHN48867.1 chemotaxis protein methyltransferase CheR [Butyrivibrio hungatei DSM 14810]